MTTSGFVFTGCSLIVCQGADTEVYRNFTMAREAGTEMYRNLTMATRYTMASRQRRTLPTRGSWMRLYRRDILILSFMKDDMNRKPVQGLLPVVFLSALSRSSIFPGSGSRFLY